MTTFANPGPIPTARDNRVREALSEAFKMQVAKLFGVMCTEMAMGPIDPQSAEIVGRFVKGFMIAERALENAEQGAGLDQA